MTENVDVSEDGSTVVYYRSQLLLIFRYQKKADSCYGLVKLRKS